MRRLVIISNRVVPLAEGTAKESAGGLAVALLDSLRETGGLWFGWSGRIGTPPLQTPQESRSAGRGRIRQVTVDLTQEDHDEYYNGYANRVLWPLLHYRVDLMEYRRSRFLGYQRVNSSFVGHVAPKIGEGDLIWIHDYHLMLMPRDLRQAGVSNRIGFFLHTPFPSSDIFVSLPNHRELVSSLCHCDLIGFQTPRDLHAFQEYIRQEAQGSVHADGTIEAFGRRLRAAVFPISIDTDAFTQMAERGVSSQPCQRLVKSLGDRLLMLGVERLDYSKGLAQRFLAYESLLERYRDCRYRVTFLQIAPPSRSEVPEYRAIRSELEALSGRINGRFSDVDWMPLRYINRGMARPNLAGVFRVSRVGVVTPLRDGMNLVAKEYVAAQDPQDPGVLLLSRFAGAAHELDAALIVNPLDYEGTAEAMQVALNMSLKERQERWQAMMKRLRRNDVTKWWKSFVAALEG